MNETSNNILECYPKKSCLGSLARKLDENLSYLPFKGKCGHEKYIGNMCDECAKGYSKSYDGKDCYSCKNVGKPFLRIILIVLSHFAIIAIGLVGIL